MVFFMTKQLHKLCLFEMVFYLQFLPEITGQVFFYTILINWLANLSTQASGL